MTESQPRVAILGAGQVAHFHMSAWKGTNAQIVAVTDVNEDTLTRFAAKYGIPQTYTDYRAALEEGSFDIIDVCTPPWLHAPMTIDALDAGKHVLCEKPFALSSAEADRMADAADRAGKVLACRLGETRLTWEARTIRDVVQSGVLGDLYFLRLISRGLYRPGIEYNPGAVWFLDRSKAGGGALYDWGVYDLDLLTCILGPLKVREVTGVTFRGVDEPALDTPYDVEEHAAAWLTLSNGLRIFWERGWATHLPPENRWDFYGTKAGLSFAPHGNMLRTPLNLHLTRYKREMVEELPVPEQARPDRNVYQDFLEAVAGEHPPALSGREAAAEMRIIEAVYAAAERGETIALTPDPALEIQA